MEENVVAPKYVETFLGKMQVIDLPNDDPDMIELSKIQLLKSNCRNAHEHRGWVRLLKDHLEKIDSRTNIH